MFGRRKREIFKYWDGRRNRRADPWQIYIGLVEHPEFDETKHIPLMEDAEDLVAMQVTVKAVRDVFGIRPFEDGGLTVQECVDLLSIYYDYCHELKKNSNRGRTSRSATEPQQLGESTTPRNSGSISTSGEQKADALTA